MTETKADTVDPKNWVEEKAVTGRPNDVAADNSTFASRKQKDAKAVKAVETEDKSVKKATAK